MISNKQRDDIVRYLDLLCQTLQGDRQSDVQHKASRPKPVKEAQRKAADSARRID